MKGGDLETGTQNTEFLQPGKITIFLFTECFATTLPKIRSSKNQQHWKDRQKTETGKDERLRWGAEPS
jgi:hypothetical protein